MQLSAYTTAGSQLAFQVFDYQSELKKVVVTAFADALALAADYNNKEKCMAWVNAGGCIYTPEHPDLSLIHI